MERSCSSSASSTHFQGTKPKSLVTSGGEDGNDGDSASQEGKESEKKMRWTPTVEPEMTAKAQMAADLTGKVLVAAMKVQMLMAKTKTLMGKLMNPAMRLKSWMLKAAPAPQNLMMKL